MKNIQKKMLVPMTVIAWAVTIWGSFQDTFKTFDKLIYWIMLVIITILVVWTLKQIKKGKI